jgi:hypothetical protein
MNPRVKQIFCYTLTSPTATNIQCRSVHIVDFSLIHISYCFRLNHFDCKEKSILREQKTSPVAWFLVFLQMFNPLNAELNSICHLLILLGDLTFMGTCIINIFQSISNKMQRYTVYLYLETALHVSGVTFTYHQERIQLHLQHLVFVTPLLLSASVVEKLEPVWVCCGWRTPPTPHSNKLK